MLVKHNLHRAVPPMTEKQFFTRRRRKSAPRAGRWWEKIAAWQKTPAARQFEKDLNSIKH
jgi:hypothetical protein